mmetsp:Transcript_20967/g.34971  ORF Transcript_20967/g.34971 Transcript_20967/m.34971 type:complete len:210 (+) Transcript_20967:1017-1646(+)
MIGILVHWICKCEASIIILHLIGVGFSFFQACEYHGVHLGRIIAFRGVLVPSHLVPFHLLHPNFPPGGIFPASLGVIGPGVGAHIPGYHGLVQPKTSFQGRIPQHGIPKHQLRVGLGLSHRLQVQVPQAAQAAVAHPGGRVGLGLGDEGDHHLARSSKLDMNLSTAGWMWALLVGNELARPHIQVILGSHVGTGFHPSWLFGVSNLGLF